MNLIYNLVSYRLFGCDVNICIFNGKSVSGEIWKTARRILSPAFTTYKLKSMHKLLCENAQKTVDYFLQKNEEFTRVEMREVFSRFTNDIIANALFGLEVNSFAEKNNTFYTMGVDNTDYSRPWRIFVILMYYVSPRLAKVIKIFLYSMKRGNNNITFNYQLVSIYFLDQFIQLDFSSFSMINSILPISVFEY